MSTKLPSFSVLDNRVTELQNKVSQIAGICDLIALASDPAGQGPDDLDSIRNAAMASRDGLNGVAADLRDLLTLDVGPPGDEDTGA